MKKPADAGFLFSGFPTRTLGNDVTFIISSLKNIE